MVKHCSYGDCKSDSRRPVTGVTFHHFPGKKKEKERSEKWIRACGRGDLRLEKAKSLKDMYICSLHFSGGNGPTAEHPDPIPRNASSYQQRMLSNPRRTLVRNRLVASDVATMSSSQEAQPSVTDEPMIVCNLPTCSNTSSFAEVQQLNDSTAYSTPNAEPVHALLIDTPGTPSNISSISLSPAHFLEVMALQWAIMADDKSVSYFYIQDGIVQKSLIVDRQTGMVKITVFGKVFDSTKDVNFVQHATNEYDIMTIITHLGVLKLCEGIKNSLAKVIESTFKQHFAPQCKLITITAKTARCKTCQDRRNYLMKKDKKVTLQTTRLHIARLNKTHLLAFAHAQRRRQKVMKRKVQRLKTKFQEHLSSGIKLKRQDNNLFTKHIQSEINCGDLDAQVKVMLMQQIQAAKVSNNSKLQMRWSPIILKWAAYLHHKSAAAYRAINASGFLKLPSERTIRRQFVHFQPGSGFKSDILLDMQEQAKLNSISSHEKYVALILDEMSIRSSIVYNKRSERIVGFEELTDGAAAVKQLAVQLNNQSATQIVVPEVATHMLALFVRGITSNFKYAYAHFPVSKLTACDLGFIVWEAIERLEDGGFRVLVVIADGAAVNRRFFKENMDDSDDGYPYKANNRYAQDERRPVYFICDPPHLLKTTRNCLYSSTLSGKKRLMWNSNKYIVWKHVSYVHEKQLKGKYRIAWKLGSKHIHLNPYSKMNVRLAAQVFSETTAFAVEHIAKIKNDSEPDETVKFLRLMNTWFDCMNTRSKERAIRTSNRNLLPFTTIQDERLSWLQNVFLKYLYDWKSSVDARKDFNAAAKKKMFLSMQTFEGHVITVKSVLAIVAFLNNKNAPYVLTAHLNQDILENEFGHMRHGGGANNNPTVEGYAQISRKINQSRGYLRPLKTGNAQQIE